MENLRELYQQVILDHNKNRVIMGSWIIKMDLLMVTIRYAEIPSIFTYALRRV